MAFKPKSKTGVKKKDDKGRGLFKRRKFCRFSAEKIEEIDYKDVDIVKVKDGYARNFLIPQGKAKRATEENKKVFEARRAELEKAQAEILAAAQAQVAKLEGVTVTVARKAGVDGRLFGSVGNVDIAEALKAQGIEIEKAMVRLPEGPFKQVGDNQVEIALHHDVVATITVSVVGEQ